MPGRRVHGRRGCDRDQAPDDQRLVHVDGHFGRPAILTQTGGQLHPRAHPAGRVDDGDGDRRRPHAQRQGRSAHRQPDRRQERSGLRADQRDVDGRSGPARRHHLLQLVRHAARAELQRAPSAATACSEAPSCRSTSATRARSSSPGRAAARRSAACATRSRRAARASSSSTATTTARAPRTTLTPSGDTETVMTHDATFPGDVPRRLDGAHRERAPAAAARRHDAHRDLTGLSSFATDLGTPAFSPDGTLIVVQPAGGSGRHDAAQQLWVMSFDKTTSTFSLPRPRRRRHRKAHRRHGPAGARSSRTASRSSSSTRASPGPTATPPQLYTRKGELSQIGWTSTSDATHVTVAQQAQRLSGDGSPTCRTLPRRST